GSVWLDSNPVALKLGRGVTGGPVDIHFDSMQIVGAGAGVDRVLIQGGIAHIGRLEINADASTAICVVVDGAALFVDFANISGCGRQLVSLANGGVFRAL